MRELGHTRFLSRMERVLSGAGVATLVLAWGFTLLWIAGSFDASAYWLTAHRPLYDVTAAGAATAYLYSPAFAQVLWPIASLPWRIFLVIWATLLAGTCAWLVHPRYWVVFVLPFVPLEIIEGNVDLLIGAAIVLGFRFPGTWAFVLLTKVTPGIGLLWFAVRREWRSLAIALGTTAIVACASFAFVPHLWFDWARVLQSNERAGPVFPQVVAVPLVLRLLVAAAIVTWGARTDRRWVVPVAAAVAMPTIWWVSLSVIVGVVPLVGGRRPIRPVESEPAEAGAASAG